LSGFVRGRKKLVCDYHDLSCSTKVFRAVFFGSVPYPSFLCIIKARKYWGVFTAMAGSLRFTPSFFTGHYREMINFCGRLSGRDTDRLEETGIAAACDIEGFYNGKINIAFTTGRSSAVC